MQTPDNPNNSLIQGTLNITQNDVLGSIMRIIDVDGLDAARAAFKQMNYYFSGLKGWAETADAAYALFAQKRKEEKQQLREEKLEVQRAAAPNLLVVSQATSDAKNIGNAKIDTMDVDVNSPGNIIAKIIKIGDKDEN